MCNCPNIPTGNNKDIIIEPRDPFSEEGLIKLMSEDDNFLNSSEYIEARNNFDKSGYIQYAQNGYRIFYKFKSSPNPLISGGPYILVEREYGFYEDLKVIVNYCTPNYLNTGDKYQEYIVNDNGKQISLVVYFENDVITFGDYIVRKIYE